MYSVRGGKLNLKGIGDDPSSSKKRKKSSSSSKSKKMKDMTDQEGDDGDQDFVKYLEEIFQFERV